MRKVPKYSMLFFCFSDGTFRQMLRLGDVWHKWTKRIFPLFSGIIGRECSMPRRSGRNSPAPGDGLLCAFCGHFLLRRPCCWRNGWTEYHSYDVAQAFTLADGTHVTLAPGATLRYRPRLDPRQVSMTGRVLYEVSRDEAHPFVVSAPSATVTVLGTVFQVLADEADTHVDVTEGRVRFCGTAGEGLVLTAGEGASLQEGIPVREVVALPNPSAWATGIFRYESTPLETVLEELSAFYGIPLSTEARGRRLTGSFSTESLDEILYLVQSALDVKIEKQ